MDILFFSIFTNFLYYCSGKLLLSTNKSDFNSQFYVYLLGLIFVSFISLSLNFFTKLSPAINSFVYLLIIVIFLFKKKFNFSGDVVKFLLITSIITFLLIIFSNVNRPDAGLYHLPFISIINEHKIIFGISNIHFRFGHTSILQYLSAINNNLLFKENGISIPLASIVSIFYIYFFYDVWRVIKKKDEIDISKVFSLFILIYISYKVNRYSGFGNDAVPHLTFFYLISYFLKKKFKEINFNKVLLISVFIFINKTTLGLVFIITIITFFIKENFNLVKILKVTFSFPAILLYLWLLKNIIISGCIIFPMKFTCINSLPWMDNTQVVKAYTESQAWSKGWPDRTNKNISMEEFNENFNWIEAWNNKHLNYILKIIIPYIIILSIITFSLKQNLINSSKKNRDFNKRFLLLISTSFLGSVSFFLIFPIYRYGYSFLITLICLFFIFIIKDNFLTKKKVNLFKFFFIFSLIIFLSKQLQKIYDNYENDKWPNIYTLNKNKIINKKNKIEIEENFYYYQSINGDNLCMYSLSPCASYSVKKNINHSIKLGYSFLTLKKIK